MDKKKISGYFYEILKEIGEDPQRSGLKDTPLRIADLYEELFSGVNQDPGDVLDTFVCDKHEELVLLKNFSFYSICEHHFLPFFGKAHIVYIPKNNVVTGFSKIAKTLDVLSRRPQIQERLTTELAEVLMDKLDPLGVIVVVEAEHLCMSMREKNTQDSSIITSAVRGIFRTDDPARAEAMSLMKSST